MPFYILLFLYLAPVCLAVYWLPRLVVWIIKKIFQLVVWIVKSFFVLLGRLLFGSVSTDRKNRQPYDSRYDRK
jgi:hypothetical protein